MKKAIIVLLILCYMPALAAVNKVYIAEASETVSSVPIHGTQSWSTYIGNSRLAFAIGYTYKIKIEYSTKAAGTFVSDVPGVAIRNVVVSNNILSCDLEVLPSTPRLTTFRIFRSLTAGSVIDPIACEVVRIGAFYFMEVKDTSNTTFHTLSATDPTALGTIIFYKNTAAKNVVFAGEHLEHAAFRHTSQSFSMNGITINPASLQQVSANYFTLFMNPASASSGSGSSLRQQFLSRIYDSAADKTYPWVSYKHVRMKPTPSGFNTGGSSSGSSGGGTVISGSTSSGFQNFLGALIKVQ